VECISRRRCAVDPVEPTGRRAERARSCAPGSGSAVSERKRPRTPRESARIERARRAVTLALARHEAHFGDKERAKVLFASVGIDYFPQRTAS